MNLVSAYLIGTGIILVCLGLYMLYTYSKSPAPNDRFLWGGLGENPFKK